MVLDDAGDLHLETAARTAPTLSPVGPDDSFLINSTSGTTGLPKCVVHTQNRWHYFHQKAVANGELTADDVFLPVIPTPFGFGIWTSHTTPIYLGATTVLIERFDAAATCAAIERHRATVLCCVSTQLMMILASDASRQHDLTSLRVVFTGGEPLPYSQAAQFEELTGATILQFYGSNETGMLSATTTGDPLHHRLRTAGRIVPEMQVRLFDGDEDVTDSGRGQPVCRGPALSLGYLGGTDHDKLFTRDGWMRMGDICELDADGYLRLAGRTSDFIIRGGKNISAVEVEEVVATHPAVAVAAAVAMPDPMFGERVCVFAELKNADHVDSTCRRSSSICLPQGMSKELLPERLEDPRRTAPLLGRKGRQRPTSRHHPIDTGADMTTERRAQGRPGVWAPVEGTTASASTSPTSRSWPSPSVTSPTSGSPRTWPGTSPGSPTGRPTCCVNPWGLWWQELTASDICVVDEDARVVRGRWDVTPAIHIHTETAPAQPRRPRGDPQPPLLRQPARRARRAARAGPSDRARCSSTTCTWCEKYDGEIDTPWRAAELAEQIGSAQPGDPGQPRRHRRRAGPRRGGVPGGVHRPGVPAGLRRDGHRPHTVDDEPRRHGWACRPR